MVKTNLLLLSLCRMMLCISAAYAIMPCLCVCVCLSITFVDSVKTNKHIFKIIPPSGSQAILVFLYQTACQYSDGNRPDGGVKYRWGRHKSRFWANIWLHCVLWSIPAASAVNLAVTNHTVFITLVAGKRASLLMAGNNNEVYDKKPQCYAVDNVMQWLIWNLSNNNKKTPHELFCWG